MARAIITVTLSVIVVMMFMFPITPLWLTLAGSLLGASWLIRLFEPDVSPAPRSTVPAVPEVISDTTIAANAEIGIDVDVAGTNAAGLKVWLVGYRV